MDGPLAPEPGDGRYFLVGALAVVVVVFGVVVINHPSVGPARAIDAVLDLQPVPTAARSPAAGATAP